MKFPEIYLTTAVPTTHTVIATGGVLVSGTALIETNIPTTYTITASGGITVSGIALTPKTYSIIASGGVSVSGSSLVVNTYSISASGGVNLGGIATVLTDWSIWQASGGAKVSGIALYAKTETITATGGVLISGSADVLRVYPAVFDTKIELGGQLGIARAYDIITDIPIVSANINGVVTHLGSFDVNFGELKITIKDQSVVFNVGLELGSSFTTQRGAGGEFLTEPMKLDAAINGYTTRTGNFTAEGLSLSSSIYCVSTKTIGIKTPIGWGLSGKITAVKGVSAYFAVTNEAPDFNIRLVKQVSGTFNTQIVLGCDIFVDSEADLPIQKVIVVNIRTGAVTEYNWQGFNSFIEHDGKYYGAGNNGIHELTGGQDNGQPINALVKWGKADFFSANKKRVTDVWVNAETEGGLKFHVYMDNTDHEYPLDDEVDKLDNHKADIGKGLQARHWQFGLSNVDGAGFRLNEALINVEVGARR